MTCFRASGECVFELEVVEQALEAAGEPVEMRDNGRLVIWLPAQPGAKYVIGVDPAGGGVKGDYSCAQVIDRNGGHAVRGVARAFFAERAGEETGATWGRIITRAAGGGEK